MANTVASEALRKTMAGTSEPEQHFASVSEGGNGDLDDSLVQVRPPQVSESLAELAESTDPPVQEGDAWEGEEAAEGDEEQEEEEEEVFDEGANEDEEEVEEVEEEEVEEEAEEQRIGLADMMGEKMRQKLQSNMSLKNEEMRIYSASQLSTEIEAIKGQERGLLTKVEQQRYVEQEMLTQIADIKEQLVGTTEIATQDLEKLKERHSELTEMVEEGDQAEEVAKFSQNIEIYERIVDGP